MRLAINMSTLRGFGSATVGRQFLASLDSHREHDYLAWVPDNWHLAPPQGGAVICQARPGLARKFLRETLSIPAAIGRWNGERLFSMGDTGSIAPRVPHLLLVHQAYLAYRPEQWGFIPPVGLRLKMGVMLAYLRSALRNVTCVTVQTESMRAHLCERLRLSPDRVVVVPSSVSEPWRALKPLAISPVPHYLCCISHAGPHKNLGVIPSMLRVLSREHPMVRCGITIERLGAPDSLVAEARRLGVLDRMDFLGPVDEAAAIDLVSRAQVVVAPTLLESFGMTFYEAMAAGRPIVAADRLFAREACGPSAIYVATQTGEAYAAAVSEWLHLYESTGRGDDVRTTVRQVFDSRDTPWSSIADRYLELLQVMA